MENGAVRLVNKVLYVIVMKEESSALLEKENFVNRSRRPSKMWAWLYESAQTPFCSELDGNIARQSQLIHVYGIHA